MTNTLNKLQFGCGSNYILGWNNMDIEVDITKPLPFANNSADYIFSEHCIEHVTLQEGYSFIAECLRILKPNGKIRLATPDIENIAYNETESYRIFQKQHGWADGNKGCGLRSIIFNHGHQYVYSKQAMAAVLHGVGFNDITFTEVGQSTDTNLQNLEHHGKVIGEEFNTLETFCIEARK